MKTLRSREKADGYLALYSQRNSSVHLMRFKVGTLPLTGEVLDSALAASVTQLRGSSTRCCLARCQNRGFPLASATLPKPCLGVPPAPQNPSQKSRIRSCFFFFFLSNWDFKEEEKRRSSSHFQKTWLRLWRFSSP